MSRRRGDPAAVVPDVEPRSYYDQPVLKAPVWTWEVPLYFAIGGVAGTSSVLGLVADAAGDVALARRARQVAAAGALVTPALLVSDLGRPERFLNMLRVFKPTSPMSVGSWVLAAWGPAAVGSVLLGELDRLPALARLARVAAGALGPVLATYTAVILTDTAVPAWHGARRELPFVFVGGALQGAGSAVQLVGPASGAATARRLVVAGNVVREAADAAMVRRLGSLARPYHQGRSGRLHRAGRWLSAGGLALALGPGRTSRPATVLAGALGVAGTVTARYAVLAAGAASAADPQATIGPQRAGLGSTR